MKITLEAKYIYMFNMEINSHYLSEDEAESQSDHLTCCTADKFTAFKPSNIM